MSHWPTDEIRSVPLERLDERFRRYRLVDAAAERAVRRSLERYGQLAPIVVWEQDEGLVLIDGFKRLQAARTLKGMESLGGPLFGSGRAGSQGGDLHVEPAEPAAAGVGGSLDRACPGA